MSSNQNESNSKRMGSITRKLHFIGVRAKIRRYVFFNILFAIVAILCWMIFTEHQAGYSVEQMKNHARYFGTEAGIDDATYVVTDVDGNQIIREPVGEPLLILLVWIVALHIVELIIILITYPFENHKIRKVLRPINEMAVKADQISRWTFDDSKYRIIEDAITKMEPGEEEVLSFHDEDLMGIETAMNNLLTRMRESYRQQARFVNDASHELRTPIAVIEGYANMLERWGKEDETVLDESIAAISHESQHMKKLVEQLLFLARGDAGNTIITYKEVSLTEMMKEIYEESLMIDENHPYRFEAPKKEGSEGDWADDKSFEEKYENITIMGDETMLKQAVRILIDNAAKYTKNGDDIILSVGVDDENVPYVQVQDTGIGMEQKDIEHMFERFYRADTARSQDGTGLGLSIAKWIVDKHKGHFEILSRKDLGTRIRIVIPRQ